MLCYIAMVIIIEYEKQDFWGSQFLPGCINRDATHAFSTASLLSNPGVDWPPAFPKCIHTKKTF